VEKVLKPQSDQGQASLVKNMESTVPSESSKLDITKLTIASEDLLLEESIEKFSELEMQRIRNSMKNDPQVNLEVGKLSKKTKSVKTDKLSQVQPALANQEDGKVTLPRSKASPLLEQGKLDSIQFSTTPENSRIESSLDQGQASIKSAANKLNSSELNAQGNQNAYETQLKLLEKNWGKALAKIIEKAIISGKEKIDISLDPQKLGKLHLTLSVVNNQTSIFINTETAAASLILSSAEDKLAQMFESSGYKLSNFQANSNGNNNSSRNGSEAKKIKLERDTGHKNELESVPSEEDSKLYSIDGRKIINIIA
jgi:flagellar hook-length control protein FliK